MIKRILKRLFSKYKHYKFNNNFDLVKPLNLPDGISESELFNFLTNVRVEDAPEREMVAYATEDFRRFVYTYSLTKGHSGKCLELGANPYFTSVLLSKFTSLNMYYANFFGSQALDIKNQKVFIPKIKNDKEEVKNFTFKNFNIEEGNFPYKKQTFDVIIFGEIIEHLLMNPCEVLREINRILKNEGTLILTTPNVARLENVVRLASGNNIYDPYSGYGPYGRHNREFNVHELSRLLKYEGFQIESCFTSDVHVNRANMYVNSLNFFKKYINDENKDRAWDLGQYIFIKAKKVKVNNNKKYPSWLYRSYPENKINFDEY